MILWKLPKVKYQQNIFYRLLYISECNGVSLFYINFSSCVVNNGTPSTYLFPCSTPPDLAYIVQQQRVQIFEVPKPAVQHLSTCLELFSGISRYRIWLMTLPEMGAGCEFDTFVHLPNF